MGGGEIRTHTNVPVGAQNEPWTVNIERWSGEVRGCSLMNRTSGRISSIDNQCNQSVNRSMGTSKENNQFLICMVIEVGGSVIGRVIFRAVPLISSWWVKLMATNEPVFLSFVWLGLIADSKVLLSNCGGLLRLFQVFSIFGWHQQLQVNQRFQNRN